MKRLATWTTGHVCLLAAGLALSACPSDTSSGDQTQRDTTTTDGVADDTATPPDTTGPPDVGADDKVGACGNGVLQPDEACDTAIPAGQPGACPTRCDDANPCTLDEVAGLACQRVCAYTPITSHADADGCCLPGGDAAADSDCRVICGNGVLEPNEACDTAIPAGFDGACPATCPTEGCQEFLFEGADCQARCTPTAVIDDFTDDDGCCPGGGNGLLDTDCTPICGNMIIEPGETCDTGLVGSCPDACDDGDACTIDALQGVDCEAECVETPLATSTDDDGCCPDGATGDDDDDCITCGNGEIDDDEFCDLMIAAGDDGACPAACDDSDPCAPQTLIGSACDRRCEGPEITLPIPGDGCCPPGANANNDDDCQAVCDNGVREMSELCDTAIASGELGACPSDCADTNVCTTDGVVGDGCQQQCANTPIVAFVPDGCCPAGGDAVKDTDCTPICGNGVVEGPSEVCDIATPSGLEGACPEACPPVGCDVFELNGATCTSTCDYVETVSAFIDGDGCCPGGANGLLDSDCPSECGNGVVEPGEACDTTLAGSCPTSCDDDDPCTITVLVGEGCDALCAVTLLPTPVDGDGCCITGTAPNDDSDCIICGNGFIDEGESCDTAISPGGTDDGSCPSACPPLDACTPQVLLGSGCDQRCEPQPITLPLPGDGCCPEAGNANIDDDCTPECGNGAREDGELCDPAVAAGAVGACPTVASCQDDAACTFNFVSGQGCQQVCADEPVIAFLDDGCCPAGGDALKDVDCDAICGNGVYEDPEEACDTAIPAGVFGSCPTTCGQIGCNLYAKTGEDCDQTCTLVDTISAFVDDDQCCPGGANALLDNDCPAQCGNGVIEPGEACDVTLIGSCPVASDCADTDPCTDDALVGNGCNAQCLNQPITDFVPGDSCCPDGASNNDDADCEVICGNGVVENGETCDVTIAPGEDGACPSVCDDGDACTDDALLGMGCLAFCQTTAITDIARSGCKLSGQCNSDNVVASCTLGVWSCDYSAVPDYQATETACDTLDNDCDGVSDGFSEPCYDGAPGTELNPPCGVGQMTCTMGVVGGCEGQVVPSDELCDGGTDEDCDGAIDEGCATTLLGYPMAAGDFISRTKIAYGDIDGNGAREIIYADQGGRVHARRMNGSYLTGFPVALGQGAIYTKPAVGDLDGDGALEIAVGTDNGFVYVLNGDATIAEGWPHRVPSQVRAGIALGDLDKDGDLELVTGAYDNKVYAWHGDGRAVPGWPVSAGGQPRYAVPAIADIDGDAFNEVIVAHSTGVTVLEHTGVAKWQQAAGNIDQSSPSVGDIDGDDTLEVVVGSTDAKVYVFTAGGFIRFGWPRTVAGQVLASPALAPVDGDSDLDIIVGSRGGNLYALDDDGTDLPGWPVAVTDVFIGSPVVADLDADGELEILTTSWNGATRAMERDGTVLPGWPVSLGTELGNATLVDLDGDGALEMFAPRRNQIVGLRLTNGSGDATLMPWPMYAHDLSNTGLAAGLAEPGVSCVGAAETCEGPPSGGCPGDPRAEVCDGRDNDCDGRVDESCRTSFPGWPQAAGGFLYHSKTTYGDLQGDGVVELIYGADDNKVHARRPDGGEPTGWPVTALGDVRSKPAVGDVDGDGSLEVAVGDDAGYVWVFNEDGSVASGWPRILGQAVRAGVVLGDLDDDGALEIIAGSYDNRVYAFNGDGTTVPGWPVQAGGQPRYAAPAVADLDGDTRLEVIVAHSLGIGVFEHDGTVKWQSPAGNIEFSSPSVGDIDDDGQLEIVVGSADKNIYLFDRFGTVPFGWPRVTTNRVDASPALAQLDGDDALEIVVGGRDGWLYMLQDDGTDAPGWPVWVGDFYVSSPVIADIDGDGGLEIVAASWACWAFAYNPGGSTVPGWPVDLGDNCGTPLIFDWQGDDRLDIAFPRDNDLYVFSLGEDTYAPARQPWPMYAHDHANTGRYDGLVHTGEACPAGVTSCTAGPSAGCPDDPRAEICDGRDNNCDGETDTSCATTAPGWPKTAGGFLYHSKTTYGDLEGDGVVEVIYGADDNKVHARKPDGSEPQGWPVTTLGDVRSKPAVGDIDGDGSLEVAVGDDAGNVWVFNEDGSAANGWPRLTGGAVRAGVVLADLDKDGDLELIVGSYDDQLYAFHGDGAMVAGFPTPAGGEPRYAVPAVADIDGDTRLEIIVAHSLGVGVFEDDGTPKWQSPIGNVEFSSPSVGDIDGDLSLEIVVGGNDSNIYLLDKNGTVPFGWPRDTDGAVYASPALANLDGGGDLEIVVGSRDGKLYGLDSGGRDLPGFPIQHEDFYVASPLIADVTGDGELDILAVGWTCRAMLYTLGGATHPGWPTDLGANCGTPLAFDWTGDGRLDIAFPRDNDIYVYSLGGGSVDPENMPWPMYAGDLANTGRYRGPAAPTEVCPNGATSCHAGAWAGCPDDVRAEVCDGLDNNCDGNTDTSCATAAPGWPQPAGGLLYHSKLTWGDLAGDGAPELIYGADDNKVHARRSDGSEPTGWPVTTFGDVRSKPAVGDVDGDGSLEVAVGDDAGYVWVFNEDGTVAAGWPRRTGGPVRAGIVLADLDNDGDLELITGSYDDKLHVFHGDGATAAGFPVPAGGEPRHAVPAVADIDGDNRLEIIVAHSTGVGVFEHDGAAKWQTNIGNIEFSSPAVGDVDDDDQLEIVVGSADRNIYLIDRNGTVPFGWPRLTGNTVNASPALGDLDGNGTLEIVVGSRDGKVYGLSHDGTDLPGFPLLHQDAYISSPVIADLSGDGVVDILVGGWSCRFMLIHASGALHPGWPVDVGDNCGTPLVFDWQGNGRAEVVLPRDNDIYVYQLGDGSWNGARAPWPAHGRGPDNAGLYTGLAAPTDVCELDTPPCDAGPASSCGADPRAEVCDGIDNDCDGRTDPSCPAPSPGWPKPAGGIVYYSGFTSGDLDGNGVRELIYGGTDDRVHARLPAGDELPGWPVVVAGDVRSEPAVADLQGDGPVEVIVGSDGGNIYVIEPGGGIAPGWPVVVGQAVRAGILIADIDIDPELEIVVGGYDDQLRVLNADGTDATGWPQPAGGEPRYATPAAADIDGDNAPEIVVAHSAGVGVFERDGQVKWQAAAGNCEYSRPAIGDVSGNGWPDIVVGSRDRKIYAFDRNGFPLPGWPKTTGGEVLGDIVLLNLDGDTALEVVAASRDGWVYGLDADGGDVAGWPVLNQDHNIASPRAHDIDGDGKLDIVSPSWAGLVFAYDLNGATKPGWPINIGSNVGAPYFFDWTGDGRLEIAFPRDDDVYVYTLGEGTAP